MFGWAPHTSPRPTARTTTWLAMAWLPVGVVIGAGGVALAVVSSHANPLNTLRTWADLGQASGAISALVAVAALGAFVVAVNEQQREARENRRELQLQRQALAKSERELYCAAETGLSMFHLKVMALSINNPNLAAVWPTAEPEPPDHINQQYLYCTLILEGVWLNARAGRFDDDDIRAAVGYLLTSPVFRRYWQAFRSKRGLVAATDGPESQYFKIVDEIYAATG